MALGAEILTILAGVVVILICAEYTVRLSVKIARHFGLSNAFIGMTVLSIGTSFPEIFTHIMGSLRILYHPDMMNQISGLVIGANVGSDIFQQNFMLSLVALIGYISVRKKDLFKDVGGLIAASMLLLALSINGFVSRLEGAVLFFGYVGYLAYLKKTDNLSIISEKRKSAGNGMWKIILLVIVLFGVMGFAANFVLESSIVLVEAWGISASFFGIIILGVASAMPELMTSLIALKKGKGIISAGILIGSNVTNPMFALGIGAIMSTYTVPPVVIWYDLPVKIITALMIYYFLRKGKQLSKPKATLLIGIYFAYLLLRQIYFPVDF